MRLTVSGPGGTATSVMTDLITVQPGPPVSLEVSPSNATFAIQESARFSAVARDQHGNIASSKISWITSTSGGSIDTSGVFTAGTIADTFTNAIRASLKTPGRELEATASVTIEPGQLSTVELKPRAVTLDIGDTQSFRFIAFDKFGNEMSDVFAAWTVPLNVGAIDVNGLLTPGTKAGSFLGAVRVDVIQGSARASATADVSVRPDPLASIDVQPSFIVVEKESNHQFEATGFDQYGNEIPGLAFLWEATGGEITQEGLFIARKFGSWEVRVAATFRASTGSGSATVAVPLVLAGLVSWWPGDGNANDLVGGNHGSLMNGATFAPGKVGQAFSFDGVDDYVDIGDIADFEITSASSMSITGWVKTSANALAMVVTKMDVFSPDFGWLVWVTIQGVLELQIANNDDHVRIETNAVNDDQWHHFAATHDGSTGNVNLYVDSVLRGSATESFGAIDDGGMPLRIGMGSQEGVAPFPGLIDEVRIYNRALTADEVKALYDAVSK